MTNKVVGVQYVIVDVGPTSPSGTTPQVGHAAAERAYASENPLEFGAFIWDTGGFASVFRGECDPNINRLNG